MKYEAKKYYKAKGKVRRRKHSQTKYSKSSTHEFLVSTISTKLCLAICYMISFLLLGYVWTLDDE